MIKLHHKVYFIKFTSKYSIIIVFVQTFIFSQGISLFYEKDMQGSLLYLIPRKCQQRKQCKLYLKALAANPLQLEFLTRLQSSSFQILTISIGLQVFNNQQSTVLSTMHFSGNKINYCDTVFIMLSKIDNISFCFHCEHFPVIGK